MDLESLQQQQRTLALQYADSLTERLRKISAAIEQLEDAKASLQRLGEIHRLLHTLSGSAATFGFAELGEAARRLDLEIRTIIEQDTVPSAVTIEGLRTQLREMGPLAAIK